eukprot:COSAG01_NODE_1505_length_10091_cov_18.350781_4_plen_257_part_00
MGTGEAAAGALWGGNAPGSPPVVVSAATRRCSFCQSPLGTCPSAPASSVVGASGADAVGLAAARCVSIVLLDQNRRRIGKSQPTRPTLRKDATAAAPQRREARAQQLLLFPRVDLPRAGAGLSLAWPDTGARGTDKLPAQAAARLNSPRRSRQRARISPRHPAAPECTAASACLHGHPARVHRVTARAARSPLLGGGGGGMLSHPDPWSAVLSGGCLRRAVAEGPRRRRRRHHRSLGVTPVAGRAEPPQLRDQGQG